MRKYIKDLIIKMINIDEIKVFFTYIWSKDFQMILKIDIQNIIH